jgi:hypothetical protein
MKSHPVLRALIVCAAITLAADATFACSCGPPPPVLGAYEHAQAVVMARVLSIEPFKDEELPEAKPTNIHEYGVATLVVEKVYKGTLRVNEQFSFGGFPNAACIWSFRKENAGHRFLLYLSTLGEGWFASTCSRSRGVEHAAEDFLYLDNMEKNLRNKDECRPSFRNLRFAPGKFNSPFEANTVYAPKVVSMPNSCTD